MNDFDHVSDGELDILVSGAKTPITDGVVVDGFLTVDALILAGEDPHVIGYVNHHTLGGAGISVVSYQKNIVGTVLREVMLAGNVDAHENLRTQVIV